MDTIAPFWRPREKPRKRLNAYGVMIRVLWACVELNYRPHAYKTGSYEHELGSEVLTSLPSRTSCSASRAFENILLTFTNSLRI